MYKKVTIILIFLCIAILFYVANKYNAVNDFKFAAAKDFVPYYEAAANQFWLVGIIISFIIWIWIDVVVIKTKQLYWLWIPLVFIAVIAITNSLYEEQLFHFKKANGMWKGGFSLSFFFNIGIIVIAAFLLLFNYFGFKMYFKKNQKLKNENI